MTGPHRPHLPSARALSRAVLALGAPAALTVLTVLVAAPAQAAPSSEAQAAIDAKAAQLVDDLGAAAGPAQDFVVDGVTGAVQDFAGGSVYWSPATGARAVQADFAATYEELVGLDEGFGFPSTDTRETPDGAGAYTHLSDADGASLYARHDGGVFVVAGPVRAKWASLGWERGLGWPTTDTGTTHDEDALYSHFDGRGGASIYWTPEHGAHSITGPLRSRWAALGWERWLGYPTTDERATPNGVGRYVHFTGVPAPGALYPGASSIYWTPATGAHAIGGPVRAKWASLGWERSALGFPTTSTDYAAEQSGRFNHFSGGSSIYYSPASGAHAVQGSIRQRWAATGWERGPLGWPTTDELATPDGRGRYTHFSGTWSGAGSVYWSPGTGAHALWGSLRQRWARDGWEKGPCGYPTSTQARTPDGRFDYLHLAGRGGCSYYGPHDSDWGPYEVSGKVRAKWAELGWERGLGYPTWDTRYVSAPARDGSRMPVENGSFERGYITWYPRTGQYSVTR